MIIDKLVTLFGFEIDEKTLLRYKKLLLDVQERARATSATLNKTFKKVKPTIKEAERSTERFFYSLARLKGQLFDTGVEGGRAFKKIGRRIRRTASNLLRFRNLLGVTIAGVLGIRTVGEVLSQGSDVEKRRMMLRRFEGGEEGAIKAEKFITDLALDTPLTVNEVTDAFIDMRQRGIDPTNGMLRALIDTNAAYGGSAQDLKLELLQIGQAWGKNKLQGQDLRILLEKRIPLLNALAEVTGDATKSNEENIASVYDMVTAGKINRKILQEAILLMGSKSVGAAKAFSRSMAGIVNRFKDFKEIFFKFINDAGFFDAVKEKLTVINEHLREMYETGELKELAKTISSKLVQAVEDLWSWLVITADEFSRGVHWTQKLKEMLVGLTDAVGGFTNLLKILLAVYLAPLVSVLLSLTVTIGSAIITMWRFVAALAAVSASGGTVGFLGALLLGFRALASGILVFLTGAGTRLLGFFVALGGLLKTFAVATATFMLTPIGRVITIITALIAAGVALYKNWDSVLLSIRNLGTYLSTRFPNTAKVVSVVFSTIKKAVLFILDPLFKVWDLLSDLPAAWETMKEAAVKALDAIASKIKPVLSGIKKISDSTFGKVGTFIGETAAKIVIGTKNLFNSEKDSSLVRGLGGNYQPLSNNIVNSSTQAKNTTDNSTIMNVEVNVKGTNDAYQTGRRIKQALVEQSKRVSVNSTTTVKY